MKTRAGAQGEEKAAAKARGTRLPSLRGILLILSILALALFPAACGGSEPVTVEPGGKVAVPRLTGLTAEEAEKALREAGLESGGRVEEFSDTAPAGTVTGSRPGPGEEVPEGSRVELVISRGPSQVPLPDLAGRSESEASSILQSMGLRAEIRRAYSETVPAGLVTSTDPAPGTPLTRGSTVAVTVSLGSAYRTCPTCGGKGTVVTSVTCPECGGSGECPT